jgi:hypothetical protein
MAIATRRHDADMELIVRPVRRNHPPELSTPAAHPTGQRPI